MLTARWPGTYVLTGMTKILAYGSLMNLRSERLSLPRLRSRRPVAEMDDLLGNQGGGSGEPVLPAPPDD